MCRRMPVALVTAEILIGGLVAYTAILLGLYFRSCGTWQLVVAIFHLTWGTIALLGIPQRSRLAWQLAYTVSTVLGTLALFLGVCLLLWVLYCGTLSEDFPVLLPQFVDGLYLFGTSYLLCRPRSAAFFETVP